MFINQSIKKMISTFQVSFPSKAFLFPPVHFVSCSHGKLSKLMATFPALRGTLGLVGTPWTCRKRTATRQDFRPTVPCILRWFPLRFPGFQTKPQFGHWETCVCPYRPKNGSQKTKEKQTKRLRLDKLLNGKHQSSFRPSCQRIPLLWSTRIRQGRSTACSCSCHSCRHLRSVPHSGCPTHQNNPRGKKRNQDSVTDCS